MTPRDQSPRDRTGDERKTTLTDALHLDPGAADAVARDENAPQPTRKPASEDVELERIAAAQRQNAEQDRTSNT